MNSPQPLRLTPLHGWAAEHGARFVDRAGGRCAAGYAGLESELQAAYQGAGLADLSLQGKFQVEGQAAGAVVRAALGGAPETIGGGLETPAGQVYSLRPDLFLVLTPIGGEAGAAERLAAAQGASPDLVTVSDLTHGLAAISLIGPASRAVLRKACALDVGPEALANYSAQATSVARTRQVIVRRDLGTLPAFTLLGAPSLAAYVWEVLAEAGQAEVLAPIGLATVEALEAADTHG